MPSLPDPFLQALSALPSPLLLAECMFRSPSHVYICSGCLRDDVPGFSARHTQTLAPYYVHPACLAETMLSDPEFLPAPLPQILPCPPLTLAQALRNLATPPAVIPLGSPHCSLPCSVAMGSLSCLSPLPEPQSTFPQHFCVFHAFL